MSNQQAAKKTMRDLPSLRKKMEHIDNIRLTRLKEAKDTRNFKVLVQNWADRELKPKILTDQQRMAIYYMTDFSHNFTYEWIATRMNITVHTLNLWRNEPLFIRELDKEITRRRSFMRLAAFKNVHRAIARGDMKATWNYLKMSGDLKENVNHTIDRTGEPTEMDDLQLEEQINLLQSQLNAAARQPKQLKKANSKAWVEE